MHTHTHSLSLRSRMLCVLMLQLAAALLLPLCCGGQGDFDDYDTTVGPEYEYNGTIEYSFFSNSSIDELDDFLSERGDTGDPETFTEADVTASNKETFTSDSQEEERPLPTDAACRTASPSMLFTLALLIQKVLRLL